MNARDRIHREARSQREISWQRRSEAYLVNGAWYRAMGERLTDLLAGEQRDQFGQILIAAFQEAENSADRQHQERCRTIEARRREACRVAGVSELTIEEEGDAFRAAGNVVSLDL